jgi:hypothetical protein
MIDNRGFINPLCSRAKNMKTRLLLLMSGVLAVGFLVTPTQAQQPTTCDYYTETGHNVCGLFRDFFNTRGGLEIFGYPITEELFEFGLRVQYFQRARMEYHPYNPARYQVQLGLLGDEFAPGDQKARISDSQKPRSNDRSRRYFPETGHSVGFSFLKFYDQNGGLDIFGYPVTEFILEKGRFVQYFQRTLMEWDPNQSRIVLHDLGEMWTDMPGHNYPTERVSPLAPGSSDAPLSAPTSITSLHATASVRDAFTGRGGYQTVWVYVYDQNGEPVQGAQVTLEIHYLSGPRNLDMAPTDEAGHSQETFELGSPTSGQLVIIDARVSYQGLTTQAQTSFFPWW